VAASACDAVIWFRKAADGGCPYGQYNLGVCCYNGSGTPKNTAAARRWYRKVRPLIL
jgi:TPR repeat protein